MNRESATTHCSVVSFGGGVNSTAMLVGMEERDERPDHIVFADTGGERPATYAHIQRMQEWLREKQFPEIVIVKQKLTLEEDCLNRETLPSKAFGFGTCSHRFKIAPQEKWQKENGIVDPMWLVGFHNQEMNRAANAKKHRGDFVRFPLIEWGWGQEDCIDAIRCAGLPIPCKSSCFFCPSMRKQEVLALAKDEPELFERAVAMERAAKEAGTLETVKGLGRRWSWEALAKADADQLKLPLFDDVQAPVCDACVDW